MTALEVLKAAREKIARGWTQGAYAENAIHGNVPVTALDARAWCPMGAVYSLVGRNSATPIFDRLVVKIPRRFKTISAWNDAPGRTQAEVLALFDKAIAAEEARKA